MNLIGHGNLLKGEMVKISTFGVCLLGQTHDADGNRLNGSVDQKLEQRKKD